MVKRVFLLILCFCLLSCSNKPSKSTDNNNPSKLTDNNASVDSLLKGRWIKITQKHEFESGISGVNVLGNPNSSSIIFGDLDTGAIWLYNGKILAKLTGGQNQPKSVNFEFARRASNNNWEVFGDPTAKSIIAVDEDYALWVYNGDTWSKLTGGEGQPESIGADTPDQMANYDAEGHTIHSYDLFSTWQIFGTPTLNSIIIGDQRGDLWMYHDKNWLKLTGGIGQPPSNESADPYYNVYGSPTEHSIVMSDKNQQLWIYNGNEWKVITGGSDQPLNIDEMFGSPIPNSIIMSDKNKYLWGYNGTVWTRLNGSQNQPAKLVDPFMMEDYSYGVYGSPTLDSIIMVDINKSLWIYDGKIWTKLTGSSSQPKKILEMYGSPNLNSIIMTDADKKLWTYNGKIWSKLMGQSGQPSAVRLVSDSSVSNAIIMTDEKRDLWTYNGSQWKQLTGGHQQPIIKDNIWLDPLYNAKKLDSIVLRDSNNDVWTYDGNIWTNQTSDKSQLYFLVQKYYAVYFETYGVNFNGIYTALSNYRPGEGGHFPEAPNSMVLLVGYRDEKGPNTNNMGLGVYNGKEWAILTSPNEGKPNNVTRVLGTPTLDFILIQDNNDDIWLHLKN